jgi:hypothetical protein
MGFDRQLDLLAAILTAVLVFVGCVFYFALSVKVSAFISTGVFLAGLVFGRRISKIVTDILR